MIKQLARRVMFHFLSHKMCTPLDWTLFPCVYDKSSWWILVMYHPYSSESHRQHWCYHKIGKQMWRMWVKWDVIKTTTTHTWWRHQVETLSALLAICAGNSPPPVNSPHKGQWRGALVFSLICVWMNDWVNNREAGDLRRRRAHYDIIVIKKQGPCAYPLR